MFNDSLTGQQEQQQQKQQQQQRNSAVKKLYPDLFESRLTVQVHSKQEQQHLFIIINLVHNLDHLPKLKFLSYMRDKPSKKTKQNKTQE